MTAIEGAEGAALLTDLMTLRELTPDRWLAEAVAPGRHNGLYGGQVAAQALVAAARTVVPERLPHSLHGYFLRRGDARQPVTFDVERDRDGHSYSARTVVARQEGRVIFRMSASFCRPEEGPDRQSVAMPATRSPEESQALPSILPGVSVRDPEPSAERTHPMRTWLRAAGCTDGDAVHQAAVLVYVSDLFSGLAHLMGPRVRAMASLDHAVWFHRPVRMDDWVLMDNVGTTVAAARGWYTGTLFDRSGAALASIAQEMVVREARGPEEG
ncbi:acyl-CoA thioesterase [Trujillonella endophytica]|uniref:Acyl-CoA thioesterase-2 n=1 Tax=Trujillonella endophytica TaxID=673521 RepID=A0A1H8PUQ3_9ACTN|nr:acyl-CoA thioesterase domain-containing protein [Trujillella endophytica]SEO45732.1 acyl-CoA thioesterase-2 [Trujillella endophytica]